MFPYASRYNSLLNICRYSCVNGRPFLPRSRRTSSTTTASCITHPSWLLLVHRLCPFALWTVISGLQIGRTLPRRLLRALRRHRTRAPEDCSELVANSPQGPVPVSDVFPVGAILHLLETRLQAVWLSPCRADPPARHPIRLGMDCRFSWHAVVPDYPFRAGSAIRSRDISSRLCPLRGRYTSAPHGAPTTTGTVSP